MSKVRVNLRLLMRVYSAFCCSSYILWKNPAVLDAGPLLVGDGGAGKARELTAAVSAVLR